MKGEKKKTTQKSTKDSSSFCNETACKSEKQNLRFALRWAANLAGQSKINING